MQTPRTPIDLPTPLAAATARAEAMLDCAPAAGIDLFDLERARRRLVGHEHEYDRARSRERRTQLVKLMDEEIGRFGRWVQEARGGGLTATP